MVKKLETSVEKVENVAGGIEANEFEPLLKYIETLVEVFPESLSSRELAERVGVSPSAVSKIRDNIFHLCNKEVLGLRHRFLLSDEPQAAGELLFHFFLQNRIDKIVGSKYFQTVLEKIGIHEAISAKWRRYGEIFNREETDFCA